MGGGGDCQNVVLRISEPREQFSGQLTLSYTIKSNLMRFCKFFSRNIATLHAVARI